MSLTISSELRKRLADEIEVAGKEGLLPEDFAKEIANALKGLSQHISVNLIVPLEITASLSSEWGELQYVYCRSCGEVYSLTESPGLAKTMRCSKCGGHLVPAPIWFITADENPSQHPTTFSPLELIESVKNAIAKKVLGKRTGRGGSASAGTKFKIVVNDPSRPIASLNVVGDNGVARNVPAVVPGHQFKYRLALIPSEQHTKPITITAFTHGRDRCLKLEPTTGKFEGVHKILFCEDVEVVQATVAFRAGHERSRKKVTVFYTAKYGRTIVYIPARCIKTKGLVIQVDRDAIAKVSEALGAGNGFDYWTALHTISHAFLVKLPQISGLDGSDFGEALSTASFEIAIFDNVQGGLGGIEGIVDKENRALMPNYEWAVRDSHHCPLACLRACKACLFTDSCYMLNFRLDRRILKALGW